MAYKFNLLHRGASVVSSIDLFDECHYGADKLFLRGKFGTPQSVGEQIKIALGESSLLDIAKLKDIYGVDIDADFKAHKLGIGNPLQKETSSNGDITVPTIALNRFHIPNKKFWNNTPPSNIANPYKASAAVTFSIRLYFRDDFAYITFGCPWSEIMDESKDKEPSEKFTNATDGTSLIPNFKLIKCHFISKEDAIIVLQELGLDVEEWDKNTIEQHTLELVDEDGSLISL